MLTKRKILFVLVFFLIGCASTANTKFTQENILKLRRGMTSDEVVEIFGKPLKTALGTCGKKTDKPWDCIIWSYDRRNAIQLVFTVNGTMYLRAWTIR